MRSASLALALVVALIVAPRASPQTADVDIAVARTFIQSLAAENFGVAVARFDATMRAALPEDRLAATWARVLAQAGPFVAIVSSRKETRGPYQVVSTTCHFERFDLDIVTTFNPAREIAGLSFPPQSVQRPGAAGAAWTLPDYATSTSYTETEITVGAGTEWPLSGTITVPVGAGPFPAVVLVHGSGGADRDETLGPNKPLKDLAVGLASRGVAVLRYDKRTLVHPARVIALAKLTVKEEVIDDALAAVTLARATPRIDGARVFVLGHSLGGMLAPRIGSTDPRIRGRIILAGNTRPLDQMLVEQSSYLANRDGRVTPDEQAVLDAVAKGAAAVRALTPADADNREPILNAPRAYWLDLRAYDPVAAAKALVGPLFVLQGERDYQVTMTDFAGWQAGLTGKPNVTLRSYPSLNHLFMTGTGPSSPEEYGEPGHVSRAVIDDLAQWVKTN